jgi:hypothetical protein
MKHKYSLGSKLKLKVYCDLLFHWIEFFKILSMFAVSHLSKRQKTAVAFGAALPIAFSKFPQSCILT